MCLQWGGFVMSETSSMLAATAEEIAPGDVLINKYRFDRLIGEGGQGWVWQAQNLALDVPVAIKVVRTEGADKSLPERLFREARAAARLGHPGIVRVFDLGQAENGAPFLVMELLEGENLADRLVQMGRFAPELAIRLLLPIADALLAAHAKGIVHRDVKPDNVFLAISGDTVQPKLLDFGIAKVSLTARPRELTESGAIVGSPAYLSPEQAQGLQDIDERADVWSFCATLYECLTGAVPFEGETWRTLRRNIVEEEPRSIVELGILDAKLWNILRRGLAKKKGQRWPSMFALGRALACWLLERGVTSDVCGVSLESRWLRCEPLAVGLLPLGTRGSGGERVLSSLGALPTGGGGIPPLSELPSPASGVMGRHYRNVERSVAQPLMREWKRAVQGRRSILFGFGAAVVIALAGIGFAKNRDRANRAAAEAGSQAVIQPARPAAARPEVTLQEPLVTPAGALTVLSATREERASLDAPAPAQRSAPVAALARERSEPKASAPPANAGTSAARPKPTPAARPPVKAKGPEGLDLLNPY